MKLASCTSDIRHRLSTMAGLAILIENVASLSGNVVCVNNNGKVCRAFEIE